MEQVGISSRVGAADAWKLNRMLQRVESDAGGYAAQSRRAVRCQTALDRAVAEHRQAYPRGLGGAALVLAILVVWPVLSDIILLNQLLVRMTAAAHLPKQLLAAMPVGLVIMEAVLSSKFRAAYLDWSSEGGSFGVVVASGVGMLLPTIAVGLVGFFMGMTESPGMRAPVTIFAVLAGVTGHIALLLGPDAGVVIGYLGSRLGVGNRSGAAANAERAFEQSAARVRKDYLAYVLARNAIAARIGEAIPLGPFTALAEEVIAEVVEGRVSPLRSGEGAGSGAAPWSPLRDEPPPADDRFSLEAEVRP